MAIRHSILLAAAVASLGPAASFAQDKASPPSGPAYQIVLRSRTAEVTPARDKNAQTGGGSIIVERPEPNTMVVTMAGSAVAGSDCHAWAAALEFKLEQELEIIPTRPGVRPPRIGMVGQLIGTLQATEGCKCSKSCGSAEEAGAVASLGCGGTSLLSIALKPAGVAGGQGLAVNYKDGPVECPGVPACYHLVASFHIGASQGKGVFYRQAAVADFDPAPQLDGYWADVLKPFRAVPRKDFGFKIVVRVVEEPAETGPAR
jgi:hypothetical protein